MSSVSYAARGGPARFMISCFSADVKVTAGSAKREASVGEASGPVLPPSISDLERRLRTRAQDSDEVIAARMAKATDEMSHWVDYDYVVINTDIDRAFAEVQSVLFAERRRRDRQTGLASFVSQLQAELQRR